MNHIHNYNVLLFLAKRPGQWVPRSEIQEHLGLTPRQFHDTAYRLRNGLGVHALVSDREGNWALATGEAD